MFHSYVARFSVGKYYVVVPEVCCGRGLALSPFLMLRWFGEEELKNRLCFSIVSVCSRRMVAVSFLCALCVWMTTLFPSEGTGIVYHIPSITLSRPRIKSELTSTGPPGTGSRTQLRWVPAPGTICLQPVVHTCKQIIWWYNKSYIFSLLCLWFGEFWCTSVFKKKNYYFRNWCQYTVSKTVTCQVHNGTETSVQRVIQSCRWPGPCSKVVR